MAFHAATCPQCSGALQIPDDVSNIKCMYCGTPIVVEHALKSAAVNIGSLIMLASKAEAGENYKEAYSLFSRVLELDPQNFEAWRGKGFSAGMQSNLIALRINELIVCYKTSLDFCKENKIFDSKKIQYAQEIFVVAQSIYSCSFRHNLEFISLPDVRLEHAARCKDLIGLCEYVLELNSSHASAIDLICEMAAKNEKTSYLDDGTRDYFKQKLEQYKVTAKDVKGETGGLTVFAVLALIVFNYLVASNLFGLGFLASVVATLVLVWVEFFGVLAIIVFLKNKGKNSS